MEQEQEKDQRTKEEIAADLKLKEAEVAFKVAETKKNSSRNIKGHI